MTREKNRQRLASSVNTDGVVVRLAPPVGVLTLRLVDTWGHAVRDVGVRLIREDNPEFYWSSSVNEDGTRAVALR